MSAAQIFLGKEISTAVVAAILAQATFVGLFLLPPPAPVIADVSDENARPIAVAITPVAMLKLGSKNPGKLPSSWERAKAVEPRNSPQDSSKDQRPRPSTQASNEPVSKRLDAGLASNDIAPLPPTPGGEIKPLPGTNTVSSASTAASSASGSPDGVPDGTETDPLKGRAADQYRAQLASWFAARFAIRGKIPFETLRKLSASAVVTIGADRRVTGFSISRASGDAIFDGEVRATLQSIQSSGIEVPAPPPLYPEMLGHTLPVSFRCTNRGQCT